MPHDHSYCLQQSAGMSKVHLTDMHASCMQAYLPKPLLEGTQEIVLITPHSVLQGLCPLAITLLLCHGKHVQCTSSQDMHWRGCELHLQHWLKRHASLQAKVIIFVKQQPRSSLEWLAY
ncbi:TPA: hypothetical protein ACH3X3_007416 [Trebouxia sp. C0006]